ncbi:MAG: ABC transporter permease [Verrucomicrobia bacterium]|nr:ABC transporter permease [Verrucomicrobiota bacterium]
MMGGYWTLVRRELSAYFYSWTGYVIIAAVLFLLGSSFASLLLVLNTRPTDLPITEVFYGTYYFWLILVMAAPVITMRSFALEKYSGTFETLMTAPVSDGQVVLAKFTGAMLFYTVTWLPLLGCWMVVRYFSRDPAVLDAGTLASTYLGILLLGALYVSMGCFASALTRSQIIAAMTSLALGITLLLVSFVALNFSAETGWKAQMYAQLGMLEQMQDFARGVVDTRPVVYYLSLTALFLYLTCKVVECRRWK